MEYSRRTGNDASTVDAASAPALLPKCSHCIVELDKQIHEVSHLRLDERPLVLEAGDILRHQMGGVKHVADALRRNQDVIRHVAELHRRTEAAFDGPAELPDERETAARGEQGVREREAVLHDRRRVLVAREHRGAVVAFLVWLRAAATAHERG